MSEGTDSRAAPAGNHGAQIDDLVNTLARIVGHRPVAMFDWPAHANAGDHFIWLGEKLIFRHRLGTRVLYECSLQHVDFLKVTRLPSDTVLVIHGGGNFGDLYAHHQRLREAIIAAFPDRRIVTMPQTIMFQNSERLALSARAMSLHPDLHVIARDQSSFTTLNSQMGLPHCYLHIDSAFALQPIVTKIVSEFGFEPERDVIHLLRRDAEAAAASPKDEATLDWATRDDLVRFTDPVPDIRVVDMARDAFGTEFDAISWRRLCAAIRLFGTARRIVTDRLHGHILAEMMGKEHDLYDNSYGKNFTFCRTWTRGNPLGRLVGSPAPPPPPILAASPPAARPAVPPGANKNVFMRQRLGIIVPYRDREQHLSRFLPHLISYFQRDGGEKIIDLKIIIVEQNDNVPFNRGSLLNAGFLAIENQVDYVCLHDVDYLPVSADYSSPDIPTRIIWWGMHSRPIRVNELSRQTLAPKIGLGAVTLFAKEHFRAVNGYSNRFFGWGFEDKDLAARCVLHSLTIGQRDGTFIPLDHDNAGFQDDGSKSTAWLENEQRYDENLQLYKVHGTNQEGLSSFSAHTDPIKYAQVSGLDRAGKSEVMHLLVNFGGPPIVKRMGADLAGLPKVLPTANVHAEVAANTAQKRQRASPQRTPKKSTPMTPIPRRQTICLCMIIRDEAPVIARCLASVRQMIDYWVIVDTGSSDGTQDIARDHFRDLPGELHERPWVNFAHNRSAALDLARSHGDYTLIIDADDVLELPPGFKLPFLNADSYAVEIWNKDRRYWRPQLIRNTLPWRYEGVLHEFLSCGVDQNNQRVLAENRSQKRLPGAKIRMSEEGARRRLAAADRFSRDAAVLENALTVETDPFLVARYKFYLAQSYLNAGDKQKALIAYQARAMLGFWDQEIFISLYRSANLKADLGFGDEDVIASYLKAHDIRKDRAEALHGAARFCRIKERFQQGYDFARRALRIKAPADGLFLEQWVYDYGLLDEFAIHAYWLGRYDEALRVCESVLRESKITEDMRARIQQNARFAREKLSLRRTG